jgi:glycosyltransferase involved in cell wall biosynthesis
MPRVSVVMPAYNAAPFIAESVASLLSQDFTDFELIVVDDGSTDATADLIESIDDPRVRLARNPVNVGIAASRNRGVELSRGEYVAWQDADDVSAPTRLSRQVALLDARPEVVIVGGFLHFFGRGRESVRRYAPDDATVRARIFRYSPVAQPAAMVRRSALITAGPYDSAMEPSEDLDMSFRLGSLGAFANVQEVVLHYRESRGSATFTRLRQIERNTLQMRRTYARHDAYTMTNLDRCYNAAQRASMSLLPAALRTRMFNRLRNTPIPDR